MNPLTNACSDTELGNTEQLIHIDTLVQFLRLVFQTKAFLPLPERARGSKEADVWYLSRGTQTNHPKCTPKEINGKHTNDIFVLRSLDAIIKDSKCTL